MQENQSRSKVRYLDARKLPARRGESKVAAVSKLNEHDTNLRVGLASNK